MELVLKQLSWTGTEPQSGCTIDGKLTGNVLRCSSGSSLRKSHPACFLLREQRQDDDRNEPKHVCFPFRRRFALSSAAAPWVLIEQLCVFACGVTIEDTTQTPMWFYTRTLRRMGAGKELVMRKRLRKASERSSICDSHDFIRSDHD
jgi:hypothetical protein